MMTSSVQTPIPIMLLISSLEYGGAERQVVELMKNIDRSQFDPVVCSLSDHVPLAENLPDQDNELLIVRKQWKYDVTTIIRVARLMRQRKIRLVHAFLFDAEIVARLAAFLAGTRVVIGSERNSDYRRPILETILQHITKYKLDALIANSNAGKDFSIRTLGLHDKSVFVVHNGVDIQRFLPDQKARSRTREHLGIPSGASLVGMVATFKKQKRHDYFFRMAQKVLQDNPDVWFVTIGEPLRDNQQGAGDYHEEIRRLVNELKIFNRCIFLGSQSDMPGIYNACDITVLTSAREGTPNVLLESMACGTPVIASDVADNAEIVPNGKAGFIVPFGDVNAFAHYVHILISDNDKRKYMGRQARNWVSEKFSTISLARNTEAIYSDILQEKGLLSVNG